MIPSSRAQRESPLTQPHVLGRSGTAQDHRQPPPHPTHTPRLVFTHPTAKPNIHLSATWGPIPAPSDTNKKVFLTRFSISVHFRPPPRCGWDEGRALFSSAMLGLPPSVCFFPPTGAKCQSQHLQGITKILRLSPPLSFTQIKHPTHEERRCSPQPSRTTQSKFRHLFHHHSPDFEKGQQLLPGFFCMCQ